MVFVNFDVQECCNATHLCTQVAGQIGVVSQQKIGSRALVPIPPGQLKELCASKADLPAGLLLYPLPKVCHRVSRDPRVRAPDSMIIPSYRVEPRELLLVVASKMVVHLQGGVTPVAGDKDVFHAVVEWKSVDWQMCLEEASMRQSCYGVAHLVGAEAEPRLDPW